MTVALLAGIMDINNKVTEVSEQIKLGKYNQAMILCEEALKDSFGHLDEQIIKGRASLYSLKGSLYNRKGLLNDAIAAYVNAIKLAPNDLEPIIAFEKLIKYAQFTKENNVINNILVNCLNQKGLYHQNIAVPGISLLKLNPAFMALIEIALEDDYEAFSDRFQSEKTLNLLSDPLLIALLEKTILPDASIEKLMTMTRRVLLEILIKEDKEQLSEKAFKICCALAIQCFYNEYLYEESSEESDKIDELINRTDLTSEALIALLGAYRPLSKLAIAGTLVNSFEKPLQEIIQVQIKDPLEEENLKKSIPNLSAISDKISENVRLQYEENPYPRWKSSEKREKREVEAILKELFPNRSIKCPPSVSPEILIAGCGTGQHAVNSANSYKGAHVLGIDLSLTSLAYARRMSLLLHVDNIAFLQGDILDISKLEQSFDIIECTGVLHHMENPLEGWRRLVDVLKPKGLMQIGLYSEIARQDVVLSREFIKKNGYPSTLEGIRECRKDILMLPDSHRREAKSLHYLLSKI
jgi:2-polyprenyl-3-methyl-5-hydroxy-6-metoxy-1,4-benzoquinol methylase/tetratricopeptide (TPR) repeat protein